MAYKKKRLLLGLGVVSILLITVGLTYAFFSYAKEGSTENVIETGNITFLYDEVDKQGNGISIEDALPMTDTQGKEQPISKSFNFKIVSNTTSNVTIPYEITLRESEDNDDIGGIVKVYLAKTENKNTTVANEEEVVTSLFSDLDDTTHNGYTEKVLYNEIVPKNSEYDQGYRLKMWIAAGTDYSEITVPAHCSDDSDKTEEQCESPLEWIEESSYYPYNAKEFSVYVNVYANGASVSDTPQILFAAEEVSYTPVDPTSECTGDDATVECAINELADRLR